jgi:hypothetical protein
MRQSGSGSKRQAGSWALIMPVMCALRSSSRASNDAAYGARGARGSRRRSVAYTLLHSCLHLNTGAMCHCRSHMLLLLLLLSPSAPKQPCATTAAALLWVGRYRRRRRPLLCTSTTTTISAIAASAGAAAATIAAPGFAVALGCAGAAAARLCVLQHLLHGSGRIQIPEQTHTSSVQCLPCECAVY